MAQIQVAIDSIISKSKLPFYIAIKGAEARVKAAELAYVEILLAAKEDAAQHLFNAARTENYVKGILDTLKSRYEEAYGIEFSEGDFDVNSVEVQATATSVATVRQVVTLKDAWKQATLAPVERVDVPYMFYDREAGIHATNTVK